jgi:hypothetical protein
LSIEIYLEGEVYCHPERSEGSTPGQILRSLRSLRMTELLIFIVHWCA